MHVWDVHLVWVNIRATNIDQNGLFEAGVLDPIMTSTLTNPCSILCLLTRRVWVLQAPQKWVFLASRKIKFADSIIWVCLKIVYPYTQWLMIIIPTKWLFHWGNIPHFQTYPFEPGPDSLSCFTRIEMWQFQPFRWICTDPFQMSQLTLRSIVPQKRFMAIWEIWAPELPSGKRLQ